MAVEIEPLDPVLWFQRIQLIANGELSIENSLRHASHLLQLAPSPLRHVLRLAIDECRFEALLEAGNFNLAARHLVAQPTSLRVEPDPDRTMIVATISCEILQRVIRGTGETEAIAIMDAWSSCVLGLRSKFGADLAKLRDVREPAVHQADELTQEHASRASLDLPRS